MATNTTPEFRAVVGGATPLPVSLSQWKRHVVMTTGQFPTAEEVAAMSARMWDSQKG